MANLTDNPRVFCLRSGYLNIWTVNPRILCWFSVQDFLVLPETPSEYKVLQVLGERLQKTAHNDSTIRFRLHPMEWFKPKNANHHYNNSDEIQVSIISSKARLLSSKRWIIDTCSQRSYARKCGKYALFFLSGLPHSSAFEFQALCARIASSKIIQT